MYTYMCYMCVYIYIYTYTYAHLSLSLSLSLYIYIYIYIYKQYKVKNNLLKEQRQEPQTIKQRKLNMRPISVLRFWISEGLTQT